MFFIPLLAFSHQGVITGIVSDPVSNLPLIGASVNLEGSVRRSTFTDQFGVYKFTSLDEGKYTIVIRYIGYEHIILNTEVKEEEKTLIKTVLKIASLQLSEITVNGGLPQQNFNSITALDLRLRAVRSSQDLLRFSPGLFIAQHAGGGKAEQIFLRGFDIDHGTDIYLSVDGMPVNMVSHAHGQGYSDLHFVIPELVENVDFGKGPYYTKLGNFTTAGYAAFQTARRVENSVKLELGSFGTLRNVNQLNLLSKKARAKKQEAYLATEILRTDGYFQSPQKFLRLNLFGKYQGYLNDNTNLTISLANFYSKWNASGQVPDRAVKTGLIGRFGSLDPTEGGNTGRRSVNVKLVNNLSNYSTLINQAYFINYGFNLYSNFTFFNNDSINGDQIQQKEIRNIYGYQSILSREFSLGNKKILTEAGLGLRYDKVNNNQLSRTKERRFLSRETFGNVSELNSNAYLESTIDLSHRFSINAGVRYDHFVFDYYDKMKNENEQSSVAKGIFSPKLNFNYRINNDFHVFLKTGTGFHSNDSRVVVAKGGEEILPRAYGADLGTIVKPFKNLMINTAVWFLHLDQEFVYVGDEGIVEPSGRTRRYGVDVSARYQFTKWLYGDIDFNFSKPRAINAEGADYIPLAPVFSSIAGITVKTNKKWNGSLRYRYLGNRPANEDYSLTAKGYFLLDALVSYSLPKIEFTLSTENLLNHKWNEAQFDTESRLSGEFQPVSELHYTPGTPFYIKAGVVINIR